MAIKEELPAEVGEYNGLIERLRKAVNSTNLGAARTWTLEKRAVHCLRLIGSGGMVSLENPGTVRRAITLLENYKGRG
jgi:hypothetical protein